MTADWLTFHHPLGLSFRHPPGWSVEHAQGGLQLVPDDFDGSSELVFVTGIDAQVGRIDDPAVIAYVDGSIGQVQPGLQRTSDPTTIDCPAGTGMLLTYEGSLGDGRAGAAAVYSVLIEDSVVSLTMMATDEKVARRRPVLDGMFATIAAGAGAGSEAGGEVSASGGEAQIDPELVGTWRQSRARHDSDGLGGGTFDSSSTTYTFAPDGTYQAAHRSFINISLPGGGGGGDASERMSVGSWSADGRFLAVRNDQGGIVFAGTYKVFSNGIELTPAGGGQLVLLARL